SCPAGEPAGFIVMYDFDAATAGMQDGRDLTLTFLRYVLQYVSYLTQHLPHP
ncbi:hypothetical protein SAMN04489725_12338, partial [Alicyclobacillus hesperidum]